MEERKMALVKKLAFTGVGILVLVIALSVYVYGAFSKSTIYDGVFVEDTDLSGLTVESANELLNRKYGSEALDMEIVFKGKSILNSSLPEKIFVRGKNFTLELSILQAEFKK